MRELIRQLPGKCLAEKLQPDRLPASGHVTGRGERTEHQDGLRAQMVSNISVCSAAVVPVEC